MRVRLYHQDYPEGKLFIDKAEVQAAEAEGAVDAPWKVGGDMPDDLKKYYGEKVVDKPIIKEELAKTVPDEPVAGEKYCECGCGQVVLKRFAPGHWKKMMDKKRMEKSSPNV